MTWCGFYIKNAAIAKRLDIISFLEFMPHFWLKIDHCTDVNLALRKNRRHFGLMVLMQMISPALRALLQPFVICEGFRMIMVEICLCLMFNTESAILYCIAVLKFAAASDGSDA